MRGDFDGLPKAALLDHRGDGLRNALKAFSMREWGKTRGGGWTADDRKAWGRLVAQGAKPSEVAKAISGMCRDEFRDKKSLLQWEYLARPKNFEKFLELYEVAVITQPASPTRAIPQNAREWRGFRIPQDYILSPRDEKAANDGCYVFLFDERAWANPANNPSGSVAAQDAKYGAGFNHPQQRNSKWPRT